MQARGDASSGVMESKKPERRASVLSGDSNANHRTVDLDATGEANKDCENTEADNAFKA
jgi:hypothetical protein